MAKTIVISYSELDAFRQCPMKHDLAYKQRWKRPMRPGSALDKGSTWHNLLEDYYRMLKRAQTEGWRLDRPKVDAEIVRIAQHHCYDDRGNQTEVQELIEWMFDRYLKMWGHDDDWEIVAVEHHSEFYLPTERGGRSRFKIKMKLDLVVKQQGRLWIVDHKSGRNLPDQKSLEFNDQFGLYTWGLRSMGRTVLGSIHNATRTQRNKDDSLEKQPPESLNRRTLMNRSEQELDTIAVEAYKSARLAYSIPVNQAPRHTNEDTCGWRCDYNQICIASRKGGDMIDMLRSTEFEQDYTRH